MAKKQRLEGKVTYMGIASMMIGILLDRLDIGMEIEIIDAFTVALFQVGGFITAVYGKARLKYRK